MKSNLSNHNPMPEQLQAVEKYHEELKLLCQQSLEKRKKKEEQKRIDKLKKK